MSWHAQAEFLADAQGYRGNVAQNRTIWILTEEIMWVSNKTECNPVKGNCRRWRLVA